MDFSIAWVTIVTGIYIGAMIGNKSKKKPHPTD